MGFKLADFYVDLGVKGEGAITLRKMVNNMADMKLETLGEIGALTTLALYLKNAALQAMTLAGGFTDVNKQYDTNITLLQRWQNVARGSHVPIDDVTQSFANMQKLLSDPMIGNPNSAAFRAGSQLGINLPSMKNADQLAEALRVAVPRTIQRMMDLQHMSHAQAVTNTGSLIQTLANTRSMMQMYTLPNGTFQSRERNSPIFNDRDVANWTALSEQAEVLKNTFMVLAQNMEAAHLPLLLKIGQEGVDVMSGKEKMTGGEKFEAGLMAAGGWASMAMLGVGVGTAGAVAIPAAVLLELYAMAREKNVHLTQNNKTDIHVAGGEAHSIATKTKEAFDSHHQNSLTKTIQQIKGKSGGW